VLKNQWFVGNRNPGTRYGASMGHEIGAEIGEEI
jgi:hypothetical protein